MASNTIPRGIQLERWKNKDKTTSVRYRVRIIKKTHKENKAFETLEEAKLFLEYSRTNLGRKKLNDIDEEQKAIEDFLASPPISVYIDRYIKDYIDTREKETELQKRNLNNIKSFYKTIKKTKVEYRDIETKGILSLIGKYPKKEFGDFKLLEIGSIEINSYIKTRLEQGLKKSSISREVSFISKLFEKLKYLDKSLFNIINPVRLYDKDLLINRSNPKKFRLSDDDENKLFTALAKYPNPEMQQIILMGLYTAMRRSEIITLEWSMITENSINLTHTKSGRPRKVHLIKEAKELLASIQKTQNPRVFIRYKTIAGFEGSFYKFMENNDLKHISFHCFRKESISKFITAIGAENSLLITELLGIENMKKFQEQHIDEPTNIDTQQGVLNSIGHSRSQTTKGFYFGIKEKSLDVKQKSK